MSSSLNLPSPDAGVCSEPVMTFEAPGFPRAQHPSEPDIFCRQAAMPGHDQERLTNGRVVVVGAGGLGGWIGLGLARMGIHDIVIIDPDRFDRTNAPRQLMFAADIAEWKAHAVARSLVPHVMSMGRVIGIAQAFPEAVAQLAAAPSILVVAVDNDAARRAASRWGLTESIPVVFTMVSRDGLRTQVVCQQPDGPCLECVLPNLGHAIAPCAAASIATCLLAASHTVALVADVLMKAMRTPTWRESSLDGSTERVANPQRRRHCSICSNL